MADKMERFTQRARRVLSLAHEEAQRLHHNYMGDEHLLLGMMREEAGMAGRILRNLGLDLAEAKEMVERLTGIGRNPSSRIELAPRTEQVLQMGIEEARRMGHHFISTHHLLLGMVRQGEGVGMDVLRRLGITPEQIRRETRRVLQETRPRRTRRSCLLGASRTRSYANHLSNTLEEALSDQAAVILVEIRGVIENLERFQAILKKRSEYEKLPEDARDSLEEAVSRLHELRRSKRSG